jgi:hypothetical protein
MPRRIVSDRPKPRNTSATLTNPLANMTVDHATKTHMSAGELRTAL